MSEGGGITLKSSSDEVHFLEVGGGGGESRVPKGNQDFVELRAGSGPTGSFRLPLAVLAASSSVARRCLLPAAGGEEERLSDSVMILPSHSEYEVRLLWELLSGSWRSRGSFDASPLVSGGLAGDLGLIWWTDRRRESRVEPDVHFLDEKVGEEKEEDYGDAPDFHQGWGEDDFAAGDDSDYNNQEEEDGDKKRPPLPKLEVKKIPPRKRRGESRRRTKYSRSETGLRNRHGISSDPFVLLERDLPLKVEKVEYKQAKEEDYYPEGNGEDFDDFEPPAAASDLDDEDFSVASRRPKKRKRTTGRRGPGRPRKIPKVEGNDDDEEQVLSVPRPSRNKKHPCPSCPGLQHESDGAPPPLFSVPDLVTHVRKQHVRFDDLPDKPGTYLCPEPGCAVPGNQRLFRSEAALETHLARSHGLAPCCYCAGLIDLDRRREHIEAEHPGLPSRWFCYICSRPFFTKTDLYRHLQKQHSGGEALTRLEEHPDCNGNISKGENDGVNNSESDGIAKLESEGGVNDVAKTSSVSDTTNADEIAKDGSKDGRKVGGGSNGTYLCVERGCGAPVRDHGDLVSHCLHAHAQWRCPLCLRGLGSSEAVARLKEAVEEERGGGGGKEARRKAWEALKCKMAVHLNTGGHPIREDKISFCGKCQMVFLSSEALRRHKLENVEAHPGSFGRRPPATKAAAAARAKWPFTVARSNGGDYEMLVCHVCGGEYRSTYIEEHQEKCNGKLRARKRYDIDKTQIFQRTMHPMAKGLKPGENGLFNCPEGCAFSHKLKGVVVGHLNRHHNPQECPECGKTCSYMTIASHMSIEHGQKYVQRTYGDAIKTFLGKCDLCLKAVFDVSMEKHREACKPRVEIQMPNQRDLKILDIVPSASGMYKCTEEGCDFESNVRAKTVHHYRLKHFRQECPYCGKEYSFYHIRKHIAEHTGETKHSCPECGEKFYDRTDLRQHKQEVHDRAAIFMCDICGESFTTRRKQVVHRSEKHTRKRNYPCPVCGQVFRSSTLVQPHLIAAHPEVALSGPGGKAAVVAKRCGHCKTSALYEESTGRKLQDCKCTKG